MTVETQLSVTGGHGLFVTSCLHLNNSNQKLGKMGSP